MTPTEISAMPDGRELDALIAERVMMWFVSPGRRLCDPARKPGDVFLGDVCDEIPPFSTDIAAAWEVVGSLIKRGLNVDVSYHENFHPGGKWRCYWSPLGLRDGANADTAPLAICRAALIAVGELA